MKRVCGTIKRKIRTYSGATSVILGKHMDKFGKKNSKIALFDPSIASENMGDSIIKYYCNQAIRDVHPDSVTIDVSTHCMPEKEEIEKIRKCKTKIVCGTNLISPHYEEYSNWKMPKNLKGYNNIITLGVGFGKYSKDISKISKFVYSNIFSKKGIHSVRDSYTEQKFHEMGIHNVVNTGCPTLWGLTPEHCNKIPAHKAENVVSTITDYDRDMNKDQKMFEILLQEYKQVYVWIQGKDDLEYLEQLIDISRVSVIERDVEAYTNILDKGNVDYVGTRLHAGIHALNRGVRSIIIAIDNRAIEMGKDMNLPIVLREKVSEVLVEKIYQPMKLNLTIPWEKIELWKKQFE